MRLTSARSVGRRNTAWPLVAGLPQRGHRADLNGAEAERAEPGERTRLLVEAGGYAERGGEVEPQRAHLQSVPAGGA